MKRDNIKEASDAEVTKAYEMLLHGEVVINGYTGEGEREGMALSDGLANAFLEFLAEEMTLRFVLEHSK